jgi:myo-inositol-1(or 4)-monophosphatase
MSRELLAVAKRAATTAATLLRGAHATSIRSKGSPRDIVTEWDLRSEEAIRGVLAETGFPILGEEGGETAGSGTIRWLVDPIDGTVNFSHGLPIFAWSRAAGAMDTGNADCRRGTSPRERSLSSKRVAK